MTMTNGEIRRNYAEAKDKRMQVTILADLNECKPEEIIEILKAEGVPANQLPRNRKAKDVAQEPEKRPTETREPEHVQDPAEPAGEATAPSAVDTAARIVGEELTRLHGIADDIVRLLEEKSEELERVTEEINRITALLGMQEGAVKND